jgi:hypothetical protein
MNEFDCSTSTPVVATYDQQSRVPTCHVPIPINQLPVSDPFHTYLIPNKPLNVEYITWNIRKFSYNNLSFTYNRKNPHGKCLSDLQIKFQNLTFSIKKDTYNNSPTAIFGLVDQFIDTAILNNDLLSI